VARRVCQVWPSPSRGGQLATVSIARVCFCEQSDDLGRDEPRRRGSWPSVQPGCLEAADGRRVYTAALSGKRLGRGSAEVDQWAHAVDAGLEGERRSSRVQLSRNDPDGAHVGGRPRREGRRPSGAEAGWSFGPGLGTRRRLAVAGIRLGPRDSGVAEGRAFVSWNSGGDFGVEVSVGVGRFFVRAKVRDRPAGDGRSTRAIAVAHTRPRAIRAVRRKSGHGRTPGDGEGIEVRRFEQGALGRARDRWYNAAGFVLGPGSKKCLRLVRAAQERQGPGPPAGEKLTKKRKSRLGRLRVTGSCHTTVRVKERIHGAGPRGEQHLRPGMRGRKQSSPIHWPATARCGGVPGTGPGGPVLPS